MGEVTKNFIEDKSNQDLVKSWVFDKIDWNNKTLEQANEKAINEKVEKSFQEFLKNKKTTFDNLDDSVYTQDAMKQIFNYYGYQYGVHIRDISLNEDPSKFVKVK